VDEGAIVAAIVAVGVLGVALALRVIVASTAICASTETIGTCVRVGSSGSVGRGMRVAGAGVTGTASRDAIGRRPQAPKAATTINASPNPTIKYATTRSPLVKARPPRRIFVGELYSQGVEAENAPQMKNHPAQVPKTALPLRGCTL
jgi:hypothetical protein